MEIVKRLGGFFLDIFQVIIFAVALFLFLYLLVLQPHKIQGDSMQPNFPDGEFLLTDKVTYRLHDPQRGDVIVFQAPLEDADEYIKRIIALPNERVSIINGDVYIDGRSLPENYLDKSVFTAAGTFLGSNKEITVPENEYFVLGDNRAFSSDSRAWGFVPGESITGRAWVIYWPPENVGKIIAPTYKTTLGNY